MSQQRDQLRAYLIAVTKDLAARSRIQVQRGSGWAEVLAAELPTVLREVQDDIIAVLTELTGGAVVAGSRLLEAAAAEQARRGISALQQLVVGLFRS